MTDQFTAVIAAVVAILAILGIVALVRVMLQRRQAHASYGAGGVSKVPVGTAGVARTAGVVLRRFGPGGPPRRRGAVGLNLSGLGFSAPGQRGRVVHQSFEIATLEKPGALIGMEGDLRRTGDDEDGEQQQCSKLDPGIPAPAHGGLIR